MKTVKFIIILASALAFSACASQKGVTGNSQSTAVSHKAVSKSDEAAQRDFLDKVNSNASYQKNISASITFHVAQDNGKEISLPGQLRMRKDEVVRLSLQMPLIGTEVGRLEFTKDYVLIVDRMHKQYVKASYDQVGFLHDNGITFYSLQALFWSRLLLPGKSSVGYTDLTKFKADLNGTAPQGICHHHRREAEIHMDSSTHERRHKQGPHRLRQQGTRHINTDMELFRIYQLRLQAVPLCQRADDNHSGDGNDKDS